MCKQCLHGTLWLPSRDDYVAPGCARAARPRSRLAEAPGQRGADAGTGLDDDLLRIGRPATSSMLVRRLEHLPKDAARGIDELDEVAVRIEHKHRADVESEVARVGQLLAMRHRRIKVVLAVAEAGNFSAAVWLACAVGGQLNHLRTGGRARNHLFDRSAYRWRCSLGNTYT